MSGIDYSKWDNIEVSSDEESGKLVSGCNVTRFDSPQSITIGGQRENEEDNVINSNTLVDQMKIESGYVSREKVISLDDYVFGGKSICGKSYYWTQTETSLTIILEIDPEMQNKDFKVNITENKVTIAHNLKTILLEEFEYAVKDDENAVFWSIKDVESLDKMQKKNINKMLVLELEKKEIDTSIRLWWKKVFKGGIETDISKFSRSSSPKKEERNLKFLQAWEKAHDEFRNKVKNRQKFNI